MSTEKPLPPPPPSRGKHREAWVGLFVVAGLAATVITLAVMTDAALFRGRYIISTTVPNAGGMRKGDPVQMHGVNIGRIMGFTISQQGVDVRLEIEGEYPIPKDSRVEVKASGLLGGMVADVIPGSSAEKVGWGDRIPGASGIGLFDKMDTLAGEADKVAVKVQNLLSDDMVRDLQGGAEGARKVAACNASRVVSDYDLASVIGIDFNFDEEGREIPGGRLELCLVHQVALDGVIDELCKGEPWAVV